MRVRNPVVALAIGALVLAGCGGEDEEQAIASDACDIYQQVIDADGESLFDPELVEEFEQLQTRADDAGLSDAEVEAAIREECPDTVAELEALFMSELDLEPEAEFEGEIDEPAPGTDEDAGEDEADLDELESEADVDEDIGEPEGGPEVDEDEES